MAVAIMAVDKIPLATGKVEIDKMVMAKNYTGARAYAETVDWTIDKSSYILAQLTIDRGEGITPITIETAKSAVAVYATKIGVTDKSVIEGCVMASLYYNKATKQLAFDYYKSLAVPNSYANRLALYLCDALNKPSDGLVIAVKMQNYIKASGYAQAIGDKVKCFELSKKALLGKPVTAPQVIEILTRLADLDFSDTTVTKAMQIDFLQSVNAKYSRFLITDKATWEPVIANVRTTLEGYGVK